jgi:hypothetical protein
VRIFKNQWFSRFAEREGILDEELKNLVTLPESGRIDAGLGGGVYINSEGHFAKTDGIIYGKSNDPEKDSPDNTCGKVYEGHAVCVLDSGSTDWAVAKRDETVWEGDDLYRTLSLNPNDGETAPNNPSVPPTLNSSCKADQTSQLYSQTSMPYGAAYSKQAVKFIAMYTKECIHLPNI